MRGDWGGFYGNSNININIKENKLENKLINKNQEKKNILSFRKGNDDENEKKNKENNELENNTNNNKLVKRELTKGEIFWYHYDNKYKTGENKYAEYINKIILANRENERETNEYFYEVEMKINNFKNNKNLFFNFEENKFFGNRFHKNLDNEIYLYSFDEYNKEDKQILFLCEYSGCTAKAYYNLNNKKFTLVVPHLFSYQLHCENLFHKLDSYNKAVQIFEAFPQFTDIQIILKYKK